MTHLANTKLLASDGTASMQHFLALQDAQEAARKAAEGVLVAWGQIQDDYTLTSTTAAQALFPWGALTLQTGRYEYSGKIYLTGMSSTIGNGQFRLGGTATIAGARTIIIGGDTATPDGAAGSISGSFFSGVASAADMVTAATNTGMVFWVDGTFRVTTAGTIIPQIALTTAAAAVVEAGSTFKVRRIADQAQFLIGPWA